MKRTWSSSSGCGLKWWTVCWRASKKPSLGTWRKVVICTRRRGGEFLARKTVRVLAIEAQITPGINTHALRPYMAPWRSSSSSSLFISQIHMQTLLLRGASFTLLFPSRHHRSCICVNWWQSARNIPEASTSLIFCRLSLGKKFWSTSASSKRKALIAGTLLKEGLLTRTHNQMGMALREPTRMAQGRRVWRAKARWKTQNRFSQCSPI